LLQFFLIATVPVCAQARNPNAARVGKDDAQNVVTIIWRNAHP
jgi:hypothetical protein